MTRWSGCCRGRDPRSGVSLGFPLKDRTLADGRVVRAVAGFDATVSAPKSLSVWWALTGDPGLAECHEKVGCLDLLSCRCECHVVLLGVPVEMAHNGAHIAAPLGRDGNQRGEEVGR